MHGLHVEIWDRNFTVGDTKLGEMVLDYEYTSSGYACFEFEWDTNDTPPNDIWPDPYVKTKYKVKKVKESGEAEKFTQICAQDQNQYGNCQSVWVVNWRDYYYSNCSGTCVEYRKLMFSTDATSVWNKRAMVIRSAQHFEDVYGEHPYRSDSNYIWACQTTETDCGTVESHDRKWIEFNITHSSRYREWETPVHELGHCFQKQLLNRDTYFYYAIQGDIWSVTTDSHATLEGWPYYVAMVSYWNPDNSLSRPLLKGSDVEEPEPESDSQLNNAKIILQVTKAFWDVDDANNENSESPGLYNDRFNADTEDIASGWYSNSSGVGVWFCSGTLNHMNMEDDPTVGEPDSNALNVEDYYWNADQRDSFTPETDFRNTLLYHNNLQWQSNN